MADLGDFIALIVTIAVFAGIIYLAYTVTSSVSDSVKSTKDRLKEKGYEISNQGMSVKTSKRMNREDYVDATQRGIIRAMGAASFGSNANGTPDVTSATSSTSSANLANLKSPPLEHRSSSSSSIKTTSSGQKIRSGGRGWRLQRNPKDIPAVSDAGGGGGGGLLVETVTGLPTVVL
ncbi:hypothetical protein EV360DRAFT_74740 [Lentinula raphanica]|nr:hypothetical protein EV360DRAFT_74740 [Lentinula raphanica]